MKTKELIKEIQKLPVRKQEEEGRMKMAADELYEDYRTDKELTAFTDLDLENFYETR
jgi:hypothetical protein